MDTLTAFAPVALTVALAGLTASVTSLVVLVFVPAFVRYHGMRALAAEVARLAQRYAARRPPQRRHSAHCPACGRLARVTSTGPRGVWTRCAVHGMRLRATRRIGDAKPILVDIADYQPLIPSPPTLSPPASLAIAAPLRLPDWLDAQTRG